VEPGYVKLNSDSGDYIGGGRDYSYSNADARITVSADGAYLWIGVAGDESWAGNFQLPAGYSELQPGSYPGLGRYGSHNAAVGGLSWTGEGLDCSTSTGWLIIDSVTYAGATLTAIDLQFEQHCEGNAPALHGEIHWDAEDATSPPGPVIPPPAELWAPAAGIAPDSGNYVYLESEPGDFVGGGGDYLYTSSDAVITLSAANGRLSVSVDGNETWQGEFQVMDVLSGPEAGYYPDLQRYPFHNPVKGGLRWSGEGRDCNEVTGWFVVDSVTYDGWTVTAIDLRFEQRCDGAAPALHGEIHWDANDTDAPGPLVPPPAGLWEPAPGVTPTSGNYIYLESDPGDYVGQGGTYLYTAADTLITVVTAEARLRLLVDGDEKWRSNFQGMSSLSRLEVGYYGNLSEYPFHNPLVGGLSWTGEGRACGSLSGWFVVDSVTYDGSTLIAIELRFEQRCAGGGPALHGAIRWDVNDPTVPPGPVVPPPEGLWEPAAGVTPDAGNYVYLESEAGDYIGFGGTYLYTQADSHITVSSELARVDVSVEGDEIWNNNYFFGMSFLDRIEPGYYGDLQKYNPMKGGLGWGGEGRRCNTVTGWFVVDNVTYDGSTLTAIDLRFEQHCEGGDPALRGEIHWGANDPTTPPGPVVPPPAGLWAPADGITPATGNYIYLESEVGDYVGDGGNYLYTLDNQISVSSFEARIDVSVDGTESWAGQFQAMSSLSRIEPGYYGDLQGFPFYNPAKGGLTWFGEGGGCNTATGWFVVDSVTYEGVTLTALDLRFEQHCEGRAPALHGEIHWSSQ
jgi:hypothetical protein